MGQKSRRVMEKREGVGVREREGERKGGSGLNR